LEEPPTGVRRAHNDGQPSPVATAAPASIDHSTGALNNMLLHEILARDRMRDEQRRARHERLARRLATARPWQRLAR
ncbi:MAG: hypothetical protein WBR33_16045, partial [Pseudonocardiaceae bacterium]